MVRLFLASSAPIRCSSEMLRRDFPRKRRKTENLLSAPACGGSGCAPSGGSQTMGGSPSGLMLLHGVRDVADPATISLRSASRRRHACLVKPKR